MAANPIIRRYRFSQFRPQQILVFSIVYSVVIFLLFFINISLYRYDNAFGSLTDLYSSLFIEFIIMQILLMWLIMPMSCSSAIQKEISEKSFDFFRMLPISAYQKTTGILVGRNLLTLVIAAINFILCVVLGGLAGLAPALLVQLFLVILCVALSMNSAALLSSIISFKKARSNIMALVLLALFAFGPIIGSLISAVENGEIQKVGAHFLTLEVPVLYLASAYILVLGIWLFIGILRRFTREYESLCSRRGAVLLMACYLFLLYGVSHHFLFSEYNVSEFSSSEHYHMFYIIGLIPLFFIPLTSIRTFDQYVEITRASCHRPGLMFRMFLHSNFLLGAVLFALWALVTSVVCFFSDEPFLQYAAIGILLLSYYLVMICLVEMYALYLPSNGKIGYLLGFIAGLYFVLPLVLSGIFGNDYIALFSLFGLLAQFEMAEDPVQLLPVLGWNVTILLPLVLLAGKKYLQIAKIRSAIEVTAP